MRLLFINPNTNPDITTLGISVARVDARLDTEFMASTGRFGATYIASRAAYAIAGHAVLDAYAHDGEGADAVLIACFGDPGLFALRELASVPIIGMAEASCHMAATLGGMFSIVTGGDRWRPMLTEFVGSIGLGRKLASVRTTRWTGGEIARNPDAALDELAACCLEAVRADGAEVVILGGLGLAGLARRLEARVPVPLIDSVIAAVATAEGIGGMRVAMPTAGSFARTPPLETAGLSNALARSLRPL